MFKRFFEDELEYLREAGAEFAEKHPEAATELDLAGRDPAVSRLLQGFAFLSGRIREQLEGGYTELLHPLIEAVWPNALRPTPAAGIVEFRPRPGVIREVLRVKRHALLFSERVQGTRCQFRTCAALTVFPLALAGIDREVHSPTRTRLRLRLELLPQASLKEMRGAPLRLHLHGDDTRRYPLYAALARDLRAVRVKVLTAEGLPAGERQLPAETVRMVGHGPEHSILPYPSPTSLVHRHLHEYFILPEKHLFLEIEGLGWLEQVPKLQTIEITLELEPAPSSGPLPEVTPEHVRLHCVPVINLFPHRAQAIYAREEHSEYLIRPEGEPAWHHEIFSVEQVKGSRNRAPRVPFYPWLSYGRQPEDEEEPTVYYQLRMRPAVAWRRREREAEQLATGGGMDTWLSFVDRTGTPMMLTSTVHVELLATNGELPTQLEPGRLSVRSKDIDASLDFAALGPLTPPAPAALDTNGLWRCATWMQQGTRAVADPEKLRLLLATYHRAAAVDGRARAGLEALLATIRGVRTTPERQVLGVPPAVLAGTHVCLQVDSGRKATPGSWLVFGGALSRWLEDSTPAETCTRLTIRDEHHELELRWDPTQGRQPTL